MLRFGLRDVLRDPDPNPGGPGPGVETPPPIDLKAVQDLIDKSVNGLSKRLEGENKKQFEGLGTKFDGLSKILETLTPKKTDPVVDPPQPGGPEITPQMKALLDEERRKREKLEESIGGFETREKAAIERAETTERDAALRSAIGKFVLALPETSQDTFEVLRSKVTKEGDGTFVVGDNTIEGYLKEYFEKRPNLLGPDHRNGSGSGPSGGKKGAPDLGSISGNSTPAERKAYLAEIQRVAGAAARGA